MAYHKPNLRLIFPRIINKVSPGYPKIEIGVTTFARKIISVIVLR